MEQKYTEEAQLENERYQKIINEQKDEFNE